MQQGRVDFQAVGAPIAAQPVDAQIRSALADVSPAEMRKTVQTLVNFNSRNTVGSMDTTLPANQGVVPAEKWIRGRFEEISKQCGGCLEVKEDQFMEPAQTGPHPRIAQPTQLTTVYAVMKGTDPSQAARRVLVTGHYDSFVVADMLNAKIAAPGANDDASGTAVSLECARVLSKHKFPATIIFVTVPGEEQGLIGSQHLARLARSENWDLEAVLNNDIVGGDTTPRDNLENKSLVRVFSEGVPSTAKPEEVRRILMFGNESDGPSRELARAVADVARTYTEGAAYHFGGPQLKPVLEMRLDRFLRGGDHYSFNKEGFTAVRFTEWRENFNHQHQAVRVENGVQYGDLIQFDDFDYMAKVARLNAASLATLASAPDAPGNVRMSTRALDNNSTLMWTAPAGAPAGTRYDILWRVTAAGDWQYHGRAEDFGQKTEGNDITATLPVSKDNVIFGVRACDAAGHCSPAVAPVPAR